MLESVDLGTLAEGGGAGALIVIGLWRLASVLAAFVKEVREFVAEYKAERADTKKAREAALKHYETEEALFLRLEEQAKAKPEGARLELLEHEVETLRGRVEREAQA